MATANTTLAFDVLTRYKGAGLKQAEREFSSFGSKLKTFGGVALKALGGVVVAGGALAATGAVIGVKTAANLEQAGVAFETLLGSGKKADKFLRDLSKFAARTPFELPGLIAASRQLIGVGESAKDVIPTLTAWGDTAGALGLSQEQFNRALLAVTQSMSKGKVQAEELMQITEAGIPIWPLLSKAMGKTVPELQKMSSEGKLLAKDVFPALEAQMGKDYGGAMIKQSKTLTGLWSTFMDTINIGLANVIQPLLPALKEGLAGAIGVAGDALGGLADWMTTTGIPAFKGFLTYIQDTLAPKIASAFTDMWDTVTGALPDLDFSAIGADLLDEAKGWGGALIRGVQIGLDTGDWGVLGSTIGKGLVAAVKNAGKFLGEMAKKIGELLGKVDWVGVGIDVGKQAVGFFIGFVIGILTFDFGKLISDLGEHWQELLFAALGLALAPAKFIGWLGKLLAKIPFVGKFLAWLLEGLASLARKIVRPVLNFLGKMFGAFIQGLTGGAAGKAVAAFSKWLSLIPIRIAVAAINVWEAAKRMMRGLGRAILGFAETIGRIIGRVISWLTAPFRNAGRWLFNTGRNILSGLKSGIIDAIGGIGSWIKSHIIDPIVGAVKRFFGIKSPSSVFAGIGGQLVAGLFKGLAATSGTAIAKKIFGDLPSALAAIVGKGLVSIASLPGKALKALGSVAGAVGGFFGGLFGGGAGAPSGNLSGNQAVVQRLAAGLYGWTGSQWSALYNLIMGESGFRNTAQNPTSSAYGMFQFLDSTWGWMGGTKTSDPSQQTLLGLKYISQVYGTPLNAYSKWSSRSPHWYDQGGWLMPGATLAINTTGRPERILPPGRGGGTGINIGTVHMHGVQDMHGFVAELQRYAKRNGGVKLKVVAP